MLFFIATLVSINGALAWFPSSYPEYCAKDMSTRNIPPLTTEQAQLVSSLNQVQALIRHGSRTPYQKYSCWANYDVTWNNCNVTELMLPSPSYNLQSRPASWLFRKIYDGSENFLGGNCYTGQLVLAGYQQEAQLGTILYDAYLNSDLKLFPTNQWTDINTDVEVYLRSDDEQRTLMSGQILMNNMFNISQEIIVPWHTGDYDLDQIYPNSEVCPKLNTLQDSIYSTSDWIDYNTSTAMKQLDNDLNAIMGEEYWSWNYIFDCLMTTVCTDRDIPDGSSDTVLMNDAIFNATIANSEITYAYRALYNQSQWAKLSMGNTAWHLRTNIENALSSPSNSLKFALFAGHDTTLMPLLAAMLGDGWDKKWPGYASIITIELYNTSTSYYTQYGQYDILFRMVYNGLPQLVPGCDDTLCNVNILLNNLAFGQEYMPCTVPNVVVDDDDNDKNCIDSGGLDVLDWSLLVALALICGALIGASVVVFTDSKKTNQLLSLIMRRRSSNSNGSNEEELDKASNHSEAINSPMLKAKTIQNVTKV